MGKYQVFTRTKDSKDELGEILSGTNTPPGTALP
jgi:hypothetical protein